MTLLQLKILREIERQAFNISAAAKALNTSQPGVSRQLQTLERNLGVPLLVRQKNRIVAFSPVGRSIMEAAKTLLNQAENIELIGKDAAGAWWSQHRTFTRGTPCCNHSRRYRKGIPMCRC